jgi:hypothetical protein
MTGKLDRQLRGDVGARSAHGQERFGPSQERRPKHA